MVEGRAGGCGQWHAPCTVWRLIKYLVLVAPVVVEGFPNKGTPDQLRVAMLYL